MKYIIANWKMNMTLIDVTNWFEQFIALAKNKRFENAVVFAPSNTYLQETYKTVKRLNDNLTTKKNEPKICYYCSAQNISCLEKGAHTGSTGALQIKDFCTYSIVGHSERREPLQTILTKKARCLENGIVPIVCFSNVDELTQYIGESEKIPSEIKPIYAWEDPDNISKDGVYRARDPNEISAVFTKMRSLVENTAPDTILIYGGSVNRQNAEKLAKIPWLEGVLIGNASLDPEHFVDIIEIFEKY